MLSIISSFRGPYEFLSNFYPCQIIFENVVQQDGIKDIVFDSVEEAYQWQKAAIFKDRRILVQIQNCHDPKIAKKLGKNAKPADFTSFSEWKNRKMLIMKELLDQKFRLDPDLCSRLKSTAPHLLVEGNNWKDEFWGYCFNTGKGKNWLGILLMELRNELS